MLDQITGSQVTEQATGGSVGIEIPKINLQSPVSGNVVVSNRNGELFCINADHGTIERLRWA